MLDPDNPYADGRWRFLLNDLDSTLYDVEVDPFAYLLENDFSFAARETAPWYSVVDNLFQKLWQNADFRARFAEEFRREMATVYAPDSILRPLRRGSPGLRLKFRRTWPAKGGDNLAGAAGPRARR